MDVELHTELSTAKPDIVPALAARGDYMSDSLVDYDLDSVLDKVATDTDDASNADAIQTLHERLIRRGHYGPYEHATAFFAVEGISVSCERQLTRHRHMSFDVQSMRYVDFDHKGAVIPSTTEGIDTDSGPADTAIADAYDDALATYNDLRDAGVESEDARFVLPLATEVNLTFSANSRALMHLIDMRLAGDAQHEIRDLAGRVLEEAKDWAPITFELYEEHAKGASKKAP